MKRSFFLAIAVCLGLLIYGCSNPISGLLLGSGKGSMQVSFSGLPQRKVQAKLSDIDHVTIAIETSRQATASQTIPLASLYNGNASASVTFPDLWPGAATVSVNVFNAASVDIGSASATTSVVASQLTHLNMSLKLSPTDVYAGNLTVVGTILPAPEAPPLPPGMNWNGQWGNGGHSNFDSAGNFYFCDSDNGLFQHGIYKVEKDSTIPQMLHSFPSDKYPYSVTVGPDGNLWAAGIGTIWKVNPTDGETTVVRDNILNAKNNPMYVNGICWTPSGLIYFGGFSNAPGSLGIKIYNPSTDEFYSLPYFPGAENAQAVCSDSQNNVYVQLYSMGIIEKITPSGSASVFVSGMETSEIDQGCESGLVTDDGTHFYALTNGNLYAFTGSNPMSCTQIATGFGSPTWNNLGIDTSRARLYAGPASRGSVLSLTFDGQTSTHLFNFGNNATYPYF